MTIRCLACSYVAPLTVGKRTRLEGTPSIYDARLVLRDRLYCVDADVGFHFNDHRGIDQVASARLTSFGPSALTPALGGQRRADGYDDLLSRGEASPPPYL